MASHKARHPSPIDPFAGLPFASTLRRGTEVGAELTATATVFGEMALAAQQTIALRLAMLAEAVTDPATLADPEFRRMGWEKLEAAAAAGTAMAEGFRVVRDGFWDWSAKQTAANEEAALRLIFARHPGEVATAQNRYAEATLDAAEIAASRLALATSRLAKLGLGPYHKAASANAKRLSRAAGRHGSAA